MMIESAMNPYYHPAESSESCQWGDIFFGVSDRNWILVGTTVHVSMVGFDNSTEDARRHRR